LSAADRRVLSFVLVGLLNALYPTVEGDFRYAVDTEGYGALQFFAEEKLVVHVCSNAYQLQVVVRTR
jgi:hypothetical protein